MIPLHPQTSSISLPHGFSVLISAGAIQYKIVPSSKLASGLKLLAEGIHAPRNFFVHKEGSPCNIQKLQHSTVFSRGEAS